MNASAQAPVDPRIGIVVIGRNEGERLRRCLESLVSAGRMVVYVDSGSTDGSRELARSRGVEVVELDLSRPFTAARARNAGFARLLQLAPDAQWAQFLDGDCVLDPGWIVTALDVARRDERTAVVCGRRRELRPQDSVYNRLCDQEWNTPLGTSTDCGGDALMRVAAFRAVNGFDPDLIAGEEPDLCLRLRQAGSQIERIDAEMTLHDAAITRFAQWWSRAVRTGHTIAERLAMLGPHTGRTFLRRGASAVFWAVAIPLLALAAIVAPWLGAPVAFRWIAVGCVLAYAVLLARIWRSRRSRGFENRAALEYAAFCILGKVPETEGIARYFVNRLRGRRTRLIEYKVAERAAAPAGAGEAGRGAGRT